MKSTKHSKNDNVKVVVRVRPPLERQVKSGLFLSTVKVDQTRTKLQLFEYYNSQCLNTNMTSLEISTKHNFVFDQVYDDESSQQQIYTNTARLSVRSSLEGYNSTIMAYGQTGTGKTYTMEGMRYNLKDDQRGIIPRAVEDIFHYIRNYDDEQTTFMVRASYIQIYNEVISDLLKNQKNNLQIRQDPKRGVYIEDASEWVIVRPEDVLNLMKKGGKQRATAKTNMNECSSRSHAVFVITLQQFKKDGEQGQQCKVAKLNLVDLAGSQRVRVTGASGKRLDECKKINLSLSCLGMVIAALTQNKSSDYIPYRNSVLTRVLSDSLGGNCKTTMVTMISPALQAFQESLSSLKFAARARNIKNTPLVNQDLDQKALIRKYQTELKKLRNELQDKSKTIIDKTRLMQLQEQKRKVEEDKNTVMKALQQRSKQFFKEREEKKRLEQKIKAFNSQLIHGGSNNNGQLAKAYDQQRKLIKQYQNRLQNLQMQKKDNPDKDIFQRQSEVLGRMTAKINERDELISRLNQQLCAYDRIAKQSQQTIQKKDQRISFLEQLLLKNNIPVPEFVQQNYKKTNKKNFYKEDGVMYDGRIIYNITDNNLHHHYQQQLKEQVENNGKDKQEIQRLKNRLQSYQNNSIISNSSLGNKRNFQQVNQEQLVCQLEQYRLNQDELLRELSDKTSKLQNMTENQKQFLKPFKSGIETIMKGLTKKENMDMKVMINEIFKLQKLVNN